MFSLPSINKILALAVENSEKHTSKFSGSTQFRLFLYFILNNMPNMADASLTKKIFKSFTLRPGCFLFRC